jgi:hypothetical protein
MKIGSIIVVNLASPVHRFFGRLIDLNPAGITIRGIDLDAFEDWTNHVAGREESGVKPATTFFPLYRIEKMILDENNGVIPSLSNAFLARVGSPVEEHLE